MEHHNLITEALNLALFGIGFVFVFLFLLVLIIRLMSIITKKIHIIHNDNDDSNFKHELDEETKFVIEQAVKMHRGA